MPRGDAARIRAYAVGLVDDARTAGETGVTVRAGGVREALELDYRKALINICQVLGPANCRGRPGWNWWRGAGPARASTRFSNSGSSEAGHCPGLRRRPRPCSRPPCEPARRPMPGRAGASVCLDRGFRRALRRVGTLRGRTVRTQPAPPDTGGLAVSAGRRCAERETVLAVPGCGPAPLDLFPSLLRHGGREGEGGCLCHRHRRATVAHCCHWLLPLVVATGCCHWSDCSAMGWRRSRGSQWLPPSVRSGDAGRVAHPVAQSVPSSLFILVVSPAFPGGHLFDGCLTWPSGSG